MPKAKTKADGLPPSGKNGKRRKQTDAEQPDGGENPTEASFLTNPLDILQPELLTDASSAALREQYQSAQPYTHCVMRDLFRPDALTKVRDEIINNIQATYKETDLFKVFQTGDLGNLDRLDKAAAAKLPTLMALKAAVYSEQFRAFVRTVTGCGELADKTDTSCNIYAPGGHLLCHDDVIGTRRVSWIIYLTDPDRPWTKEDGGALELYPLEQGQQHTPAVHPSVCHLPTFNTMAMFTVLPGKSFHAVQEVLSPDKPRMSISGWYHAPTEPADAHQASLQQLQARAKAPASQPADVTEDGAGAQEECDPLSAGQDNVGAEGFQPFTTQGAVSGDASGDQALTEDDLSFLIRYVNPAYLSEAAWPKIQARFKDDGSVQLQQFLAKGLAERILKALRAADKGDALGHNALPEYEAGAHGGWDAVGPPHKQRYLRYGTGVSETAGGGSSGQQGGGQGEVARDCKAIGELMAQVRDTLFRSAAFQRLLRAFTTLHMVGQRGEARRFRPGLDYTVAHYGILTRDPRLDVVLCFVDEGAQGGGSSAQGGAGPSIWTDGEVGGYEAYLLADEDKEGAAAAEVYRQDAEGSGVLNVEAACNSLNLVLRDEGLMKFVKYVSAAAPGSRWDVAMEYLPEDDSEEEEEEEEENGMRNAETEMKVKAKEEEEEEEEEEQKRPSKGQNGKTTEKEGKKKRGAQQQGEQKSQEQQEKISKADQQVSKKKKGSVGDQDGEKEQEDGKKSGGAVKATRKGRSDGHQGAGRKEMQGEGTAAAGKAGQAASAAAGAGKAQAKRRRA